MLLFLFYNTLLCISIPYCVRVVLFFAVRRSFFLLHSRFSTRLDEQWVDDDNDVHKSSCIQTHRYCLHVSVVRPGLAWTGLCWNDDIWVWNHPIQMPLSLWRRSSHVHRYTHLLMCLYACVSICLCRGFWNCVTHRIHAQLGMCALNVCKRRT